MFLEKTLAVLRAAIRIQAQTSVAQAAETLQQYNIYIVHSPTNALFIKLGKV